MTRRRLIGVAVAALVGAVAVALLPLVAPSLAEALAPLAGPLEALVGLGVPAVALLVLAFVRARRGREAAAPPPATWDPDPGGQPGGDGYPGEPFDRQLSVVTDPGASEGRREDARERLREELRETATRVYCRVEGVEREAAREAVAAGTWTDDDWAAAFLAEEGRGPAVGWWPWLRAVLAPGSADERLVARTLDAVDRLEGER